LRKKPSELNEEERALLARLFKYSPLLQQAYQIENELTAIFDEKQELRQAKAQIRSWKKRVQASGLSCFDRFLATLDKWLDEITNYFIDRLSSGFVEGLNNKIKVIKRRGSGILNIKHLYKRLYLDLGGYQEFGKQS
jgi:Transposase and inactivated derivatives